MSPMLNAAPPSALPERPVRARRGRPLKCADAAQAELSTDERAKRAYELRMEGLSWSQVAQRLGYSDKAAAWAGAMRYAPQVMPIARVDRNARRATELARLDQLWPLVAVSLGSSDARARAQAIDRALKMLDLYARWLECKPSETPKAASLAQYGLAVIP